MEVQPSKLKSVELKDSHSLLAFLSVSFPKEVEMQESVFGCRKLVAMVPDGAANMFGVHAGLSTILQRPVAPWNANTHCTAHCVQRVSCRMI